MFLWLTVLVAVASSARILRDPVTFISSLRLEKSSNNYEWTQEWLDAVPVDHFSFGNKDSFSLRYFINTNDYQPGGPILFYTGNEGKLEAFAENSGFMWDLAPQLNGAVVFAEHRFYGKTMPYGNKSYTSTDRLGFLSSEQALADFVLLIDYLKEKRIPGATNSPVIAFGGSYGGMLAAWIRIKYSHKVAGAIAASAPVFWFMENDIAEDTYDMIVTRAAVNSGCNAKAVQRGWAAFENLAQTKKGRDYLNQVFKLEDKSLVQKPEDHAFLRAYMRDIFESMAMVNYPYPTNFLSPLPGWPVKEACRFLSSVAKTDEEAAEQMYDVANLYYNSSGTISKLCANLEKCSGGFAALGDPLGWPWQACTEMVMPLCGSGMPNDFFWKDCPFSVENVIDGCSQTFAGLGYDRTMTRPLWATQNYGTEFPTASNIVFSNGYLDPWSGGGWAMKPKVEGSLVSLILMEGAHHYDLRGAHKDDTDEVKKARATEKMHIQKWIKEHHKRQ